MMRNKTKNKRFQEVDISLVTGEVYHIFNKSIARFKIFNRDVEFIRMRELLKYYEIERPPIRFSYFSRLRNSYKSKITGVHRESEFNKHRRRIVDVLAYSLMPTHFHLVLKQLGEKGISIFMNNISNSYTRYFNTKHKRKGPLWEGRFKRILVDSDEQLLHLTRYIHLNSVTAHLVNKPEEWLWSSYREYIREDKNNQICRYGNVLDIQPTSYKKFVMDRIDYQRGLAKIKHLLFQE